MSSTENLKNTQPQSARADGIVWLASYPKSGNTWFRIFLCNLLSKSEEPVPLDKIGFLSASDRSLFDRIAGVMSSDLTHDEVDQLRPAIYEQAVREASEMPLFFKTHDAWTYLQNGRPLLSERATAGAVYFVRNPLDVAASFAHHSGHNSADKTIAKMANHDYASCAADNRLYTRLRQRLLAWSDHVRSWMDAGIPLHMVRYEDMHASPVDTFTDIVRFIGLEHSIAEIQTALELSQFHRLQKMEQADGFQERLVSTQMFFRKGKVESWRDDLTAQQARQIVNDHRDVMSKLGYSPDDVLLSL